MKLARLHCDPEKYRSAIQIFDALREVLPRFRQKRAFLRESEPITPLIRREMSNDAGTPGSNRDRAVCALVNKAANTHAAVRLLADAGHGDDAMVLGRALLENATLLRWLLIDPIYRLDLFCISDALFVRRWGELIEQHFQEKPELLRTAKESISKEVLAVAQFFGNTIHKWAQVLHPSGKIHHVNVEAMMEEVAAHHGTSSTFQYDVIYYLHSAFVHSTANSMRSFRHLRSEEYFDAELGPNDYRCDEALGGANISMLLTLEAAAQYLGFKDIEETLDEIFARMRALTEEEVRESRDDSVL